MTWKEAVDEILEAERRFHQQTKDEDRGLSLRMAVKTWFIFHMHYQEEDEEDDEQEEGPDELPPAGPPWE